MTTTDSEMMEDPVRPVIDDELVDRLMAQVDAEGLELLGPEGVLTELTSRILSRGLEVEMADHLGYEKGDPAGWGSGVWASPRIVEGCLLMVEVSHSPALLCNRFGCRACGTI